MRGFWAIVTTIATLVYVGLVLTNKVDMATASVFSSIYGYIFWKEAQNA